MIILEETQNFLKTGVDFMLQISTGVWVCRVFPNDHPVRFTKSSEAVEKSWVLDVTYTEKRLGS